MAKLPEGFGSVDPLAQAQFLEMDVFLSNYLLSSQGDRVAMAHSIEGRVPFLDHRVIEFAMGLPAHWKLRALDEKHILKRLGARYLPHRIVRRPKQPYRAPVREAFAGFLEDDRFARFTREDSIRAAGLFDAAKVSLFKKRITQAPAVNETQSQALAAILTTQMLHERFVTGFPQDPPERQVDRVVRRNGAGALGTQGNGPN
jgi:asparagine synthase (glutamine-hydrolysing)